MAALPNPIDNNIADMTDLFQRTKNPAAAWRAYSLARSHNRSIPAAVQAEVDRFASLVSEAASKAICTEIDIAFATAIQPGKKRRADAPRKTSPKQERPLVNFRAAQLYIAWRGDAKENPVRQLQNDWRDYRIFSAILKHVEDGKRPGEAREIVQKTNYSNLSDSTVQQIWKRLKTKRPGKAS